MTSPRVDYKTFTPAEWEAELVGMLEAPGPVAPARPGERWLYLVPRPPSHENCGLIQVPGPPPLLQEERDQWVDWLVGCFRNCVLTAYRTHGASGEYRKKLVTVPLKNVKRRQLLADAGDLLWETETSPALWIAHKVSLHIAEGPPETKRRAKKSNPLDLAPSLGWVFELEDIRSKRGWAKSRIADLCPTQIQIPTRQLQMYRRWESARNLVAGSSLGSEAEARELVEILLPSDTWNQELASLREEAELANRMYREAARRGEWIWDWIA